MRRIFAKDTLMAISYDVNRMLNSQDNTKDIINMIQKKLATLKDTSYYRVVY